MPTVGTHPYQDQGTLSLAFRDVGGGTYQVVSIKTFYCRRWDLYIPIEQMRTTSCRKK
jgi:hypothetical protein